MTQDDRDKDTDHFGEGEDEDHMTQNDRDKDTDYFGGGEDQDDKRT